LEPRCFLALQIATRIIGPEEFNMNINNKLNDEVKAAIPQGHGATST
jgi:hypothetical protein